MSLADVRGYFKGRVETLGLKEWKNPYDISNIPENIIASQFNVILGTVVPVTFSQQALHSKCPVNVRAFTKAYREHMAAYDSAIALADDILKAILNPVQRLNASGIKNVTFGSLSIDSFAPDNDNIMVLNFIFNVDVFIDVCP